MPGHSAVQPSLSASAAWESHQISGLSAVSLSTSAPSDALAAVQHSWSCSLGTVHVDPKPNISLFSQQVSQFDFYLVLLGAPRKSWEGFSYKLSAKASLNVVHINST